VRARCSAQRAVDGHPPLPQEPWLAALAAAHLLLLAAVVTLRSNQPFQLAFLIASFGAVRCGEAINAALATHWRVFASRPYFDANGAFYSLAVAAPLLCTVCVQLALQLASAWRLMVGLKAAQIRGARAGARAAASGRPARTCSEARKRE
jgi:hypothetical protein